MYRPRIIPCLLLKSKGLVKTIRFKDPRYVGDPLNAIRIFNEKGVDELFFVDIQASKGGNGEGIQYEILSKISNQSFMPLAYGGGVKTVEEAKKILSLGFEKISVNSHALKQPSIISELSKILGSQSVIVTMDVKKTMLGGYRVYDYVLNKTTEKSPIPWAKEAEKLGAGEIVLNSVDRDGTMGGYDLDLIKQVSEEVSIPLVALGGASSLSNLNEAIEAGASAVAAGSLFIFYGPHRAVLINYPEEEINLV